MKNLLPNQLKLLRVDAVCDVVEERSAKSKTPNFQQQTLPYLSCDDSSIHSIPSNAVSRWRSQSPYRHHFLSSRRSQFPFLLSSFLFSWFFILSSNLWTLQNGWWIASECPRIGASAWRRSGHEFPRSSPPSLRTPTPFSKP